MGAVTSGLVFAAEFGCVSTECAAEGLGCAMATDCTLITASIAVPTVKAIRGDYSHSQGHEQNSEGPRETSMDQSWSHDFYTDSTR